MGLMTSHSGHDVFEDAHEQETRGGGERPGQQFRQPAGRTLRRAGGMLAGHHVKDGRAHKTERRLRDPIMALIPEELFRHLR